GGTWMKIRNTFIIFIVSGFWHGANWTFIVWGALNAIYFLPLLLAKKNRQNIDIVAQDSFCPSLKDFMAMGITFSLTVFAWIFFRAHNLTHAFQYIGDIFGPSLLSLPKVLALMVTLLILLFIIIEWFGRRGEYAIEKIGIKWFKPFRWSFYLLLAVIIFLFDG